MVNFLSKRELVSPVRLPQLLEVRSQQKMEKYQLLKLQISEFSALFRMENQDTKTYIIIILCLYIYGLGRQETLKR